MKEGDTISSRDGYIEFIGGPLRVPFSLSEVQEVIGKSASDVAKSDLFVWFVGWIAGSRDHYRADLIGQRLYFTEVNFRFHLPSYSKTAFQRKWVDHVDSRNLFNTLREPFGKKTQHHFKGVIIEGLARTRP